MRKLFFCLLLSPLFCACTSDYEIIENNLSKEQEEVIFTEEADTYGKAVANEIQNFAKSTSFRELKNIHNYKEFSELSFRKAIKTREETPNKELSKRRKSEEEKLFYSFTQLSHNQLNILLAVDKAWKESKTYNLFLMQLLSIKDQIKELPLIEQKRMEYFVSAIYFGIKEISELRKNGYLYPVSKRYIKRLQTSSESTNTEVTGPSSGNIESWCKADIGKVWLIAAAEPTAIGELIATGVTITAGTYILYEFLVRCFDKEEKEEEKEKEKEEEQEEGLTKEECINYYVRCVERNKKNKAHCDDCLRFCDTQHKLDPRCTY